MKQGQRSSCKEKSLTRNFHAYARLMSPMDGPRLIRIAKHLAAVFKISRGK